MTTNFTPPRRRNAQVRTYWRLIQHALKTRTIADAAAGREVYKRLQQLNARIAADSRDTLEGVDVADLVERAHSLLGLSRKSLLEPKGSRNEH